MLLPIPVRRVLVFVVFSTRFQYDFTVLTTELGNLLYAVMQTRS
jgi:hypothetical protein